MVSSTARSKSRDVRCAVAIGLIMFGARHGRHRPAIRRAVRVTIVTPFRVHVRLRRGRRAASRLLPVHQFDRFSIAVPAGWQISHVGHYVYIRDPANSGIFLLIDQSDQPQPNALADWRQQAAARQSSYHLPPGRCKPGVTLHAKLASRTGNLMSAIRKINVPSVGRLPAFCHATVAGNQVFVSGMLGAREGALELVPGGLSVRLRRRRCLTFPDGKLATPAARLLAKSHKTRRRRSVGRRLQRQPEPADRHPRLSALTRTSVLPGRAEPDQRR